MKIKTAEASGRVLDCLVAMALGYEVEVVTGQQRYDLLDEEGKADTAYAELIRTAGPRLYWNNPVPHTPLP